MACSFFQQHQYIFCSKSIRKCGI